MDKAKADKAIGTLMAYVDAMEDENAKLKREVEVWREFHKAGLEQARLEKWWIGYCFDSIAGKGTTRDSKEVHDAKMTVHTAMLAAFTMPSRKGQLVEAPAGISLR